MFKHEVISQYRVVHMRGTTRFAVIGCGSDGGLNFGVVVTKFFGEILDLN